MQVAPTRVLPGVIPQLLAALVVREEMRDVQSTEDDEYWQVKFAELYTMPC